MFLSNVLFNENKKLGVEILALTKFFVLISLHDHC